MVLFLSLKIYHHIGGLENSWRHAIKLSFIYHHIGGLEKYFL
ncbi:hypothetical protein [uncultured Gammaproteobacteria bacterium]|nr:hypothetical protein [uncultured Gammaproteobacteria bacterium]CAC9587497.1 hypothetical protein [uncultured Gammaproteobacteria bacterium]CAC9966449.1 hypothetical protein [uncultured Gammaproteobacteria bacterium]